MDSLNRHEDYGQESLDETHLSDDPIKQFSEWLVEAEENSIYEPNANSSPWCAIERQVC